jgi:hypothetical protein
MARSSLKDLLQRLQVGCPHPFFEGTCSIFAFVPEQQVEAPPEAVSAPPVANPVQEAPQAEATALRSSLKRPASVAAVKGKGTAATNTPFDVCIILLRLYTHAPSHVMT